jgi:Arc/MetJ-type ribon-helix-helix transcriptional regulator
VLRSVAAGVQLADVAWEGALQHGGTAQKVSVSLPAELIETVRSHTGAGGFSRYVTEAVRRQLQHDLLGELLDELEAEYGPIPEGMIEEAIREWPDYEEK